MRCMACFMVPTIALAVFVGYHMNISVPDTIEKPWVVRAVMGGKKIVIGAGMIFRKFSDADPMPYVRKGFILMEMLVGQADMDESTTVTMETIAGVNVEIHEPSTAGTNRPAVVYLHGAGGTLYGAFGICNYLAKENKAVVFNIEWNPPVSTLSTQAEKVVFTVMKTAPRWGINNRKISLAGDSIGGTVAAGIALKLRDTGAKPPLASQILLYPPMQALDSHTPSRGTHENYPGFSRTPEVLAHLTLLYIDGDQAFIRDMLANTHISALSMAKYWKYVNFRLLPKNMIPADYKPVQARAPESPISAEFEKAILNPYNFPLMASNTSNLPPTFLLTLNWDAYGNEGVLFAQRLNSSSNKLTHIHENRAWHGSINFLSPACISPAVEEILQKISLFLKQWAVDL